MCSPLRAGVQEKKGIGDYHLDCVPRYARGFKKEDDSRTFQVAVFPATRGGSRIASVKRQILALCSPLRAGVQGSEAEHPRNLCCVPRYARGFKGFSTCIPVSPLVFPATRGGSRDCTQTETAVRACSPLRAGVQGAWNVLSNDVDCVPRYARGFKDQQDRGAAAFVVFPATRGGSR